MTKEEVFKLLTINGRDKVKRTQEEMKSSIIEIVDNNNMLHQVVNDKNKKLLNTFLKMGADTNKEDKHDCSPCYYALLMSDKEIIWILLNYSGRVVAPIDVLMELFIEKLLNDDEDFFELLYHMEFKDNLEDIENSEKRNVGHLAVIL